MPTKGNARSLLRRGTLASAQGGGPPPGSGPTFTAGPTVSAITTSGATVTSTLSEVCQFWLEYGTSLSYGTESTHETSFSYSTHVQAVVGQVDNTLIYVRAHAVNAAGYETTATTSFTTAALPAGQFPPDGVLAAISQPSVSLPTLLVPFTDQRSGAQVMRLTNVDQDRNIYSKKAAFNCDGTRLYLGVATKTLWNTSSWTVVRTLPSLSEWTWSNVSPTKTYYVSLPATLASYDVVTSAVTTIHNFALDGYSNIYLGEYEGAISYNDHVINLHMRRTSDAKAVLGVYDISTNTLRTRAMSFTTSNGSFPVETNSQISPSGQYLVVNFEGGIGSSFEQGVWVLDATTAGLPNVRQLVTDGSHGDSGYDTTGHEVWVQCYGSSVYAFRLNAAGFDYDILGAANAFRSGHVSMRAIARQGWAGLSVYDGTLSNAGHHQLAMVKLDGSHTIEFFCHDHHANVGTSGAQYYTDPMACVNPAGTIMVFGSEWGATNSYCYVTGMTL